MSRIHLSRATLSLVLAALGTAVPPVAHAGPNKVTCPESPSSAPVTQVEPVDGSALAMAGSDLLPGMTLATPGSALSVVDLVSRSQAYSITSGAGVASGQVRTKVSADDSGACVIQHQVTVDAAATACVKTVQLRRFKHPAAGLRGDWRNNAVPAGQPSTMVRRSGGTGRTVNFDVLVCPGESSRWLVLGTSEVEAQDAARVRVRASDGTYSSELKTYGPVVP